MDYQVKLRGHRVELGEIENILRRHEKIDEVAVLLNDKGFLVAYYTTILEEPLSKNVVRGYLQNHLPKFMVPTYYMQLDQFPRTIIQKIDRKALPDVQKDAQEKAVPTNDVEDKLVAIWKEILKNASISTEESFFDLGGNSLLLAKVQTKIKEVFHVQIPMIDFFGASTIKDFAKLVKSYGGDLDAVQKS
ncbi:MAG: non-ribosomal peptide synthetase, partial [Chlamydiia bacterium]|nr:non-ribosomal peptide synthetase [Chlamydiia bacterium]